MTPEQAAEDWKIPDEPLTAERAALMAAAVLDMATDASHVPEHSAALVQVADGWTLLHTALAESAHAIFDSIEQRPTPVTVNIEGLTVKNVDPQEMSIEQQLTAGWPRLDRRPKPEPDYSLDNRERAREWIDGFRQATEEDQVNCVALLLGAASDAQGCVADGHMAMVRALAELGWTPPSEDSP